MNGDDEGRELLESAFNYFAKGIAPHVRETSSILCFAGDGLEMRTLVASGLMRLLSQRDYSVTPLGARAAHRLDLAREALGLGETRRLSAITFHGPVGAVNTGDGGSAHGAVSVNSVDGAMHRLVDLQEQLTDVTDEMWRILRRLRELELVHSETDRLREAVEELEVEAFLRRLGSEKRKAVVEIIRIAVPALVPMLPELSV